MCVYKPFTVLLIGPKNRTLVQIRTYTLNGPILVRKMGLSPILDFYKEIIPFWVSLYWKDFTIGLTFSW